MYEFHCSPVYLSDVRDQHMELAEFSSFFCMFRKEGIGILIWRIGVDSWIQCRILDYVSRMQGFQSGVASLRHHNPVRLYKLHSKHKKRMTSAPQILA